MSLSISYTEHQILVEYRRLLGLETHFDAVQWVAARLKISEESVLTVLEQHYVATDYVTSISQD